MHSKIINPRQHGRFIFHNRGSCSKTVSYLGHEAKAQGMNVSFFNDHRLDASAEEVQSAIDSNIKGLRKQQDKFYSLVLSPSSEELKHVGTHSKKWEAYTQRVMKNYAENFRLKDGRKLTSSDLVWFATVHQERTEKVGLDKGKTKSGEHLHVHVIVSAKDKTGMIRLNPRGSKSHFPIRDWQVESGKTFQQTFGYEKPTVSEKLTKDMPLEQVERHRQRIRDKVAYLNQYFIGSQKLDADRTLAIGREQQHSKGFFFNLHRLTKQYQEGRLVNDPYHVMQTGKDEAVSFPEHTLMHLGRGAKDVVHEAGDLGEVRKRKKQQRPSTQLER